MKKMYLGILTAVAISGSQALAIACSLHNNYGAPIEFIEKRANDAESYSKAMPHRVNKLISGSRATITGLFFEDALSIRTVGGKFHDVSYILGQIKREQALHKNETAVIMVNKGWNPLYWSLSFSWERAQ